MKRNDHFWSVSILLVLLEPVNGADFKYVFVVWIGRQIREIYEKTWHRRLCTYVQDVSSFIKRLSNDPFLEYFNIIGTVRISQLCRFQICIYCLDRKSNTGDRRENIDDFFLSFRLPETNNYFFSA